MRMQGLATSCCISGFSLPCSKKYQKSPAFIFTAKPGMRVIVMSSACCSSSGRTGSLSTTDRRNTEAHFLLRMAG